MLLCVELTGSGGSYLLGLIVYVLEYELSSGNLLFVLVDLPKHACFSELGTAFRTTSCV